MAKRTQLVDVMAAYQRQIVEQQIESWGADLALDGVDVPVFLMMGRDDPRQKGFDVVSAAIELIPPGKARYVFTPLPGDEGFVGLSFLKRLAEGRPGEVKVFPYRMDRQAYDALRNGSSYMVMCSLYEPFGAATEAYLAGMPVVARATGGLVQQVAPAATAALSRRGRQIASLFHDRNSAPTGFLFSEPAVVDRRQWWQKIIDCDYWSGDAKTDRVLDRKGTPLFDAMVQRAAWALQDAIELYQAEQLKYAEMIYSGFRMLDQFSWSRSVREYRRLYDRVCE
jgi:glycogen synthase